MFNSVINNNMENSTTPQPQVPNSMTKKQLFKAFYPTPERLVRISMKLIIIDNRRKHPKNEQISDEELVRTKTVFKDEIFELFKEFGVPKFFL